MAVDSKVCRPPSYINAWNGREEGVGYSFGSASSLLDATNSYMLVLHIFCIEYKDTGWLLSVPYQLLWTEVMYVCVCVCSVESSDINWKRKKSGGIKIICQSEMRDFSAMAFITDHVNYLIEQWFPGQYTSFCLFIFWSNPVDLSPSAQIKLMDNLQFSLFVKCAP